MTSATISTFQWHIKIQDLKLYYLIELSLSFENIGHLKMIRCCFAWDKVACIMTINFVGFLFTEPGSLWPKGTTEIQLDR